jgi:DNA-binding LacI/PurR family transcriptional regulator
LTLKELSEIAGVSPATISLVLNNKRGVGAQTREHVQQVLAKYNYTLPKRAPETTKNLLFLKYSKHGMIVEENANFISTIMDSIETDCQNEGYSLSIAVSKGELADTLKNINSSNYSGLILLGTELDSKSSIRKDVWVRLPPPAFTQTLSSAWVFLCAYGHICSTPMDMDRVIFRDFLEIS